MQRKESRNRASTLSEGHQEHAGQPECRYMCGRTVTHFCSECLSGFYCQEHAARHDELVRKMGGSIFAVSLPATAGKTNS